MPTVRGYHSDVSSVGPTCNIRLAVTAREFIILLMKRGVESAGNFVFRQVSPHLDSVHVSGLTLRRLMSYIYGAPILDVSRSHTTTQHSR